MVYDLFSNLRPQYLKMLLMEVSLHGFLLSPSLNFMRKLIIPCFQYKLTYNGSLNCTEDMRYPYTRYPYKYNVGWCHNKFVIITNGLTDDLMVST